METNSEGAEAVDEDENKQPRVRLLSILLEKRNLGWGMLGGGLVYFILSLLGIHFISCPIKDLTGLDCPGCGLTRGSRALIDGDWATALGYHWFTPVFMLFWASVGFGLILPQPWRGKFLTLVKTSERVTRWPAILGIGLVIYALTRNFIT